MADMKPSEKKPAIYGRATSLDGPRAIIPESSRPEYDASVARLREAAQASAAAPDTRIERLADYLYAEYTGRGLGSRRTSIYADKWVRFARRALAHAGIEVPRG